MEALSAVFVIFMIIIGITNIAIEIYRLINKIKEHLRVELYRAQREVNRLNANRRDIGYRARLSFRRNNPVGQQFNEN